MSGTEKLILAGAFAFVLSLLTIMSGRAQVGLNVGPGTAMTASVLNALYATPSGLTPQTIASLPTCVVGIVGEKAFVSNGQATGYVGLAVSTTGSTYAPVICEQTGASSYGWVYGG